MNTTPCDASVVFPTDGGAGTACGACITSMCATGLSMCQNDCTCVPAIECLAANGNNYTLCMDTALPAISAGNPGLMTLAGCITNNCTSACAPTN